MLEGEWRTSGQIFLGAGWIRIDSGTVGGQAGRLYRLVRSFLAFPNSFAGFARVPLLFRAIEVSAGERARITEKPGLNFTLLSTQ